jgi:NAD(P)-dependent dehydrogenase (short-subunit alcohol dehydrogenase family)
MDIPSEQLEICLSVLQQISEDPTLIDRHDRFKSLIAKIYKQGRKHSRQIKQENPQTEEIQIQEEIGILKIQKLRQLEQKNRHIEDLRLQEATVMVQIQQQKKSIVASSELVDKLQHLRKPISCYICKQPYTQIHFFYHLLCPKCAEFNYQKRNQHTNLTGRTALVTGGRIKIGYQTALRLLQDGARVIVTTRFPRDCAYRYSLEPDFDRWRDRLEIYGLDLRNIPALEAFIDRLLDKETALDILINNAAQTIKRPLEFYQHLLEREQKLPEILSQDAEALIPDRCDRKSVLIETHPNYPEDLSILENKYFPPHTIDIDGEQLDLRPTNSWLLKLAEVNTIELLEVHLINAIAPFILNSKLKPLLLKSSFKRRFMINVSAMEGQFNRSDKTPNHPHTNMAKAALNMMTRTSAIDYAIDNIFMNSVDTGWVTDENPYFQKMRSQTEKGFYAPLDIIDGMARIYDPIVQGIKNYNIPSFGCFLKDYVPYPW